MKSVIELHDKYMQARVGTCMRRPVSLHFLLILSDLRCSSEVQQKLSFAFLHTCRDWHTRQPLLRQYHPNCSVLEPEA